VTAMQDPTQNPTENPRAGFFTRLMAVAIDAALLSVILGATAWLLEVVARGLRRFAPPVDLVAVLAAVAPLLIAFYHVGFWSTVGQTPGKWVLGIRVIGPDGRPPTIGRALLRWVGYWLSALSLYLGFLWILGPRRLGLHDRLARTEVRHVPQEVVEESRGATLRRRWSQRPRSAHS
jgi:uncharacterized RDD family membrane protein YckC